MKRNKKLGEFIVDCKHSGDNYRALACAAIHTAIHDAIDLQAPRLKTKTVRMLRDGSLDPLRELEMFAEDGIRDLAEGFGLRIDITPFQEVLRREVIKAKKIREKFPLPTIQRKPVATQRPSKPVDRKPIQLKFDL